MARWDPWRGCHRCSEGCKFCYIHKGDAKRGVDTNCITKTEKFYAPIARKKNGGYKMKSGLVYVCFSSDFLLEDADPWRAECWDMIRQRQDCQFLFLTRWIERFMDCIPEDWGDGWDNVIVGCTVENQQRADEQLRIFSQLPIKHKNIICQPMISSIELEHYLPGVELVVAGGESDRYARSMHYDWVLSLREQCKMQNVSFEFRQFGTHFIKDGKEYSLQTRVNTYSTPRGGAVMTQKQAEAEPKYRLAKYVLQVLLDAGTITAEEMELARRKLCIKYQPFTCCLEKGIQWPIKL